MLLIALSLACLEITFVVKALTFSFGIQNDCYMSQCKYSKRKNCKERQAAHLSFKPAGVKPLKTFYILILLH